MQENVIFIGASNTVEEISTVPRNGSFITELRSLNSDWENVDLFDKAYSGWGVSNYYGEIDLVNDTVFEYDPDYIVIVLGGNDFLLGKSPDLFEVRYKWVLDAILYLNTNSIIKQIFIANIFWGTLELESELVDIFQLYQDIIANAASEYNFPLLDFFNVTSDHPEFYVDDIHLNDKGHQAISTEVNRVVQPYLNGKISRIHSFPTITEIYLNTYNRNTSGTTFILALISLNLICLIRKKKVKF